MQINEVVDENGKTWLYLDTQSMQIERDGQVLAVKGNEILETDKILDYADQDFEESKKKCKFMQKKSVLGAISFESFRKALNRLSAGTVE